MSVQSKERQEALRIVIENYLQERLATRIEKLEDTDPKAISLRAEHELKTYIETRARKASQRKMVTHIVKAIHQDAKGTEIFCEPAKLPRTRAVGTAHLRNFKSDSTGNAAAMDVDSFLSIQFEDKTLLELIESSDPDLAAIIDDDSTKADSLMKEFRKVKSIPEEMATHTKAKQVYWLTGSDPRDDTEFVLLAPLFASSLTHYLFESVRHHKFGEEAKEAREAKKRNKFHSSTLIEFPNLAIQKIGGSNSQNISTLNKDRNGINYLFGSLPPEWSDRKVFPIFGTPSSFERFGRRAKLKRQLDELRNLLESDPPSNAATRTKREQMLMESIDTCLYYAGQLQNLEPGWSSDERCKLFTAEKIWLDPGRTYIDQEFAELEAWQNWKEVVARNFGLWVNQNLGKKLPMGDFEFEHWRDRFLDCLN